jgi:hypothetical protein
MCAENLKMSKLSKTPHTSSKSQRLSLRAIWRGILKEKHGWKSFDHFVNSIGAYPGRNSYLKPKVMSRVLGPDNFEWAIWSVDELRERLKETHKRGYKSYRQYWLMRKFGVSIDWYEEQLKRQKGVCAICEKPETAFRKGKLLPLCVDHDHETLEVRGLLCNACNIGIGALQDNPKIFRRAINYIIENRGRQKEVSNVVRLVKS